MFDIGALELVLIGVVALLVVGPERLPKLARTAGLWVGHARRALTSVKAEIDREVKAEELKEILRKQAESNPLESILEETVIRDDGSLPSTSSAGASGSVSRVDVDAARDSPTLTPAAISGGSPGQSGNGPERSTAVRDDP
ncbi:MAG: Sec-independent protein translocase protein TatB [Thiohalocapsa sp.]